MKDDAGKGIRMYFRGTVGRLCLQSIWQTMYIRIYVYILEFGWKVIGVQ